MIRHTHFFWLLLILLPTQLGLHFWPEWAGVLGRRVDYLAPTVYLTDILMFLIVSSYLLDQFILRVRENSKSKFLNPKWFDHAHHPELAEGQIQIFKIQMFKTKYTWIVGVVVFVAINIIGATNVPVAVYKWLKVLELVGLGWYIVKTRPSLSAISFPLAAGILYSSVLAIAQFALQHSVGGPLWWLGERTFGVDTPGIARFDSCQLLASLEHWRSGSAVSCQLFLRPYATFPHPNVLGGYLAVILPLVIYQFSNPTNNPIRPMNVSMKKIYQWFMGITLGVDVIALLLTFSRSAIVVGGVGIGISIWFLVFRKKMHRVLAHILYTIPFILFFIATAWSFSPKEESVVVRQQLNTAAIKLWQTSPLFGVGLGNFLVRLPEVLPSRTIYFLQPVHNIYLLLLSEVGVVGIGLIVISLWTLAGHGTRNNKQKITGILVPERATCCISLVVLLILGLVDHYPVTLQQGQLLLTVLVGMSLREVREVQKVREVREVKK